MYWGFREWRRDYIREMLATRPANGETRKPGSEQRNGLVAGGAGGAAGSGVDERRPYEAGARLGGLRPDYSFARGSGSRSAARMSAGSSSCVSFR
jgi:hypothetical protein